MRLGRRFLWLLLLAFVLAVVAVNSAKGLTDHEQKQELAPDEFFDEGDSSDYESEDGEGESPKQEYAPPMPHPGTYNQLPPPPPLSYPPILPLPVPQYPSVNYEQQQQQVYVQQPLQVQSYQQPQVYEQYVSQPAQVYQAPQQVVTTNYTPVVVEQQVYPQQQQVYQQQQPIYQQPQQQQQQYVPQVVSTNYTPVAVEQPIYQQQQQVSYQQPQVAYKQQANYTTTVSVVKQTYAPQIISTNYSRPQQVVAQYRPQQQVYTASGLAQRYSFADLAPFTLPFGYRGNHWSLHYYKFLNYVKCPKQPYARGPNYLDIEQAFAFALAQLGQVQQGGIQFMNASSPTFAARHQISSFLSQKSARMDEEGLLVEFVSIYLADRLCMSKWDRQRYLPSLTKLVSTSQFPNSHSCSQYYSANRQQWRTQNCYAQKYRNFDGFCNNPYHPYWGKSNVCHIRLLSPDYADGLSLPRESHNRRYELPNPRVIANVMHQDVILKGPYNLMKMQWGQFINHDISSTALSSYDGLVDCCKQPHTRGCWPIPVPVGDRFYSPLNVSCLNFIRSGVCPTCQLGPRQQSNKNTAFLDASHVYGNTPEQAIQLRAFVGGLLKTSSGRNGEQLLPISSAQEQCIGTCFQAGDSRANQHPALTALHVIMLRNHNRHAQALARRHPNWTDEIIFQEARRINIAEYQMITYGEYFPIVFGPVLSAYYQLTPSQGLGHTIYNPKVDPTSWNEYTTAACRFGHSQINSVFGLYNKIGFQGQELEMEHSLRTFRLREWYFRPGFLSEGLMPQILNGLLSRRSYNVDPYVTVDVRNYLYASPREHHGGDLAATNIWRGRDHGLPGYVHYLDYCFNYKVRGWRELQLFIPPYTLNQLRRIYRVVENIDLFTGGLAERHFPGADIGPTFACINGIQYHHLKFGDRYYFEHGGQAGSFTPIQLEELRRATLARLLCRNGNLQAVPQYAFLQASIYNPLVNCSQIPDIDYNRF